MRSTFSARRSCRSSLSDAWRSLASLWRDWGRPGRAVIRFRPRLESLEDRLAPATNVISTVTGTGVGGYKGDGGAAVAAQLTNPNGMVLDSSGDLFIADLGANVVREVNAKTGVITTYAGDGASGYSGDGGPAASAELSSPAGLAMDAAGDLYIADGGNNVVREVKVATHVITTVAGDGTAGYSGDHGNALFAELNLPSALAIDPSGNIYIADRTNCVVREVKAGVITTVAGDGAIGYTGDGGAATAAELGNPNGLALDSSGDLFISCDFGGVVREVKAGVITTAAGTGVQGYTGDGGLATSAELGTPTGVVVDSSGDLFIADQNNDAVREVSASIGLITTFAGNGIDNYGGDGGPALAAQVAPASLALDSSGDLFIADGEHSVVRKVSASNELTVAPATLPSAQVGAPYIETLTAAAGVGPYTYTLASGALPAGVSLSSAGALIGTPTASGPFTFTVQVADSSATPLTIDIHERLFVLAAAAPVFPINTIAGTGIAGYTGDGGLAVAARLNDPSGIAVDASGDVFIADSGNNVVREVNAKTGVVTTIAGNGNAGFSGDGGAAMVAELDDPLTVALDSSGDVFIADAGNERVREVSAATGKISTVAGDGAIGYTGDNGPATSAAVQPWAVAVDSSGDLFIADFNDSVVRKVNATTHVITSVAGTGAFGYNGDGIPAKSAQLFFPDGLVVDSSGDLFIADSNNMRVREVSAATGKISTIAGDGTPGYTGDGGAATAAELFEPEGLALDSSGDLFITEPGNRTLRQVNAKTGVITTLVGDGTQNDYQGDGGPASAAEMIYPSGVGVDVAGNAYVVDQAANAIRKVALTTPLTLIAAVLPPTAPQAPYTQVLTATGGNGPYTFRLTAGQLPPGLAFGNGFITGAATALGSYTFTVEAFDSSTGTGPLAAVRNYTIVVSPPISTVAGTGTAGYSGDNGSAIASNLHEPSDVATDASGDLFIADTFNNVIREIHGPTGLITTIAGNNKAGYSGDGAAATAAELNTPTSLALDSSGDLFIVDSGNNVVREVNAKTGIITTVAGNGTAGYGGDNGPAVSAELNGPVGLAIDAAGDLFIADTQNDIVREVNAATHVITTVAGSPGVQGYSGDGGKATAAELLSPQGVAVDSSGDLFIADSGNNVVREVNVKTGVITTIAGVNSSKNGGTGDGGPAASATLGGPVGLALDSSGDLFIADLLDRSIREVNAQTGIISTVAGGSTGYGGDGGPATAAQLGIVDIISELASGESNPFGEGIVLDAAGDLFIADTTNNAVREVPAAPTLVVTPTLLPSAQQGSAYVETLAAAGGTGPYTFTLAAGALPAGLSLSAAGVLSGAPTVSGAFGFTIQVADSSALPRVDDCHYTLSVLAPGASAAPLTTVAGNGKFGDSGDGGPAVNAESVDPHLAVDAAADLYLADEQDNTVREVNAKTGIITTIAGTGVAGYTGDGGPAVNAELDDLQGIALDAAGDIYLADASDSVVREINAKTGIITTVAGNGTAGYSGDGGPATVAALDRPGPLAVDASGDLFIVDSGNNVVREVSAKTGFITTVAGDAVAGFSGDGGPAVNAELSANIQGLAVDSSGDLFIADTANDRVREVVEATGKIITFAGDGTFGDKGDGGAASAAELSFPAGLTVDSSGDLLIADAFNSVVREVNAKTGVITAIVGDGLSGYVDGQPAAAGQLAFPSAVGLDGAGNIYIADTLNAVIRKVTVTTPLTLGPASLPGSVEGLGYSQTITASGGTAPYTFRLTAGALPPGMALSAVGLIFGTPTAAGSYTFTIQASDASTGTGPLNAVQNFTLTVTPPVISTVAGTGTQGDTGDNGSAVAAELSTPQSVAVDAAGDLFISDLPHEVVREVNAKTGVITTVAGNGTAGYSGDHGLAVSAELDSPGGLALDSSGDLFIADISNNVVREVNLKTGIITTFAGNGTYGDKGDGGPAVSAELTAPGNVAVDSSGDLFIEDTGAVREVNAKTGNISTVAGTGTVGYTGDGGPATSAELSTYLNFTVDSSGDLFIGDELNHVVREVNAKTGFISTVVGTGKLGSTGDGGPATAAELGGPTGVAVDSSGDLFIVDSGDRVREVSGASGLISTLVGNGTLGFSGDGGLPTAAQLDSDGGLALDSSGDLFIADTNNNVIRKVTLVNGLTFTPTLLPYAQQGTTYVETLTAAGGTGPYTFTLVGALPAGLSLSSTGVLSGTPTASGAFTFTIQVVDSSATPRTIAVHDRLFVLAAAAPVVPINTIVGTNQVAGGYNGDFGPATAAALESPTSLAVDASGDAFIADSGNNVVREVSGKTGIITTIAGNGKPGYTGDGGTATVAELNDPSGVTVDSSGDVFISDPGHHVVREVNGATGIITTFAGDGTSGSGGDNGPAVNAELEAPEGLAVDSSGDLFIVDSFSDVVREVNAKTHVITTVAGVAGAAGYTGDGGPAVSAELNFPFEAAVDPSGDLFIGDGDNHVVREVVKATGKISTVAGTGTAGDTGDGGKATSAELSGPDYVAVDASGDLFIGDGVSKVVREVNGKTGIISTLVGDGGQTVAGDGQPAESAEMLLVRGLAVDSAGNLYITDGLSNAIRKITLSAPLTLGPASLPAATQGTGYSQAITPGGGTAPYVFHVTAGALPVGVSLSSAGVLSGTPTALGSYTFTVQAFDASTGTGPLTVVQNFTLTVTAATNLTLSPPTLPAPQVDVFYDQVLGASGGTAPYSFTVSSGQLPAGLTLSASGVLSGTPSAAGPFSFTVKATDSSAKPLTGTLTYSGTVAAAVVALSPPTLPAPQVGVAYSQTATASGGIGPYTFSLSSGQLPNGLSLSIGGVLSGTPTAGGPFSFTIQAADSSATPVTGSQNYSFTVAAPTIVLSPSSLAAGQVGAGYSQTIAVGGGTAPYTFAVTVGSLPAGLTLSTAGVLSGVPTAAGVATFTVTATDSSTGQGAPYANGRSYTLTVNKSALTFSPPTLPTARVGAAYNQTITASGGTASYTFQIAGGALPAGLSLSSAGVLSGTPTTGGAFSITVQATDSSATPVHATFTYALNVVVPAPTAVLKSDGSLWQYDAAGGFDLLSPAATILAISEVVDGSGAADVFAVTTSGHSLYEHTPAGWKDLSDGFFAQISAAVDAAGNAVVFGVLGASSSVPNSLWEYDPAFKSLWVNLSPAGTILSVSAVSTAQGEVAFAVVTTGNNLWQYSAGTQFPWAQLSVGSFAQVSAGLNGAGQAIAFSVLTDNSLWEYNPAFSGQWRLLSPSGTILSATAGGADAVFAVTAGRTLWENSLSVWTELSPGSFASVSGGRTTAGEDEVFAVLTDSSLWWYDAAFASTSAWEELLGSGASATASPHKL